MDIKEVTTEIKKLSTAIEEVKVAMNIQAAHTMLVTIYGDRLSGLIGRYNDLREAVQKSIEEAREHEPHSKEAEFHNSVTQDWFKRQHEFDKSHPLIHALMSQSSKLVHAMMGR